MVEPNTAGPSATMGISTGVEAYLDSVGNALEGIISAHCKEVRIHVKARYTLFAYCEKLEESQHFA